MELEVDMVTPYIGESRLQVSHQSQRKYANQIRAATVLPVAARTFSFFKF